MAEPTTDQRAREVADRYWERLLELDPITATQVGDERFDDRLPDPSDDGIARRASVLESALGEVEGIERTGLGSDGRTTLDVLDAIARQGLEAIEYRLDRLQAVSHLLGPGQLLADLASLQRADTPERAARYAGRLREIPTYLERVGASARDGVADGMTAPAVVVDRTIRQVQRLLATAPEQSPGMTPMPAESPQRGAVAAILRDEVWPAYGRYLEMLTGYRRHAREDSPGMSALPRGDEIYASQIRAHTTLPLTAEEVHATGLRELEAVQEESRALSGRLGYPDAGAALAAHGATGRNTATSREQLLELARRQVEASWEAARAFFGRLPTSPCEVKAVEEFREDDMPPAFYYSPSADGSRPGIYYVNLGDLPTRPLHALAAVSYHEANPGHHFQTSVEQEFAARPALRRFGGIWAGTAFSEGWGLYCERLADEMGLYQDDYERLGMLAAQACRAVRLVVDTGLHALGWDRERAVDLTASAGLARPTAEAEVDRYISWPGQALAYKTGQVEIQRLRAEAAALPGFSLPAWHDRLLELGTLPLPVLRREMQLST
jgi:uncharacterized protein (DUF885 family)